MATFNRFEDILAWQKARVIVNRIYDITDVEPFSRDYNLLNQIRRAAISIMLNIAEGFGRRSNKEFTQYLVVSHGSCSEVQAALYIAFDRKYISDTSFKVTYDLCDEDSKIIMGLIKALR